VILVMQRNHEDADLKETIERVEGLGLKANVIVGTERTVIAAVGDERDGFKEALEACPGVSEVLPILAPYKMASIEVQPERTVIRAAAGIALG